jgi:hypothetical protein
LPFGPFSMVEMTAGMSLWIIGSQDNPYPSFLLIFFAPFSISISCPFVFYLFISKSPWFVTLHSLLAIFLMLSWNSFIIICYVSIPCLLIYSPLGSKFQEKSNQAYPLFNWNLSTWIRAHHL